MNDDRKTTVYMSAAALVIVGIFWLVSHHYDVTHHSILPAMYVQGDHAHEDCPPVARLK
jgi:hypothetical protein